MQIHRIKHSFSSGEITPLTAGRYDFSRRGNACQTLRNAICVAQGPATRRPGTRFVFDLGAIPDFDTTSPVRMIPFIFNEEQAYILIFFKNITTGLINVIFAVKGGGILVYPDPPPTECPPGTLITVTAGDIVALELPGVWDLENMDYAQSADELYIAQSTQMPFVITRYDHTCWVGNTVPFTVYPAEWTATDGYPERVTFHQQRIVFAANKTNRQTVWLSKAGNFLDFGVSAPLVASDSITFVLDSGTQNKIMWLESGKSLMVGTMANEWTVTGSDQAALTPENIVAQKQTNNGSVAIKPLTVNLATLFVEQYGKTVNEFIYDLNYDSYKNSSLTILAPHIFEQTSIKNWCYQQSPHSLIWAVLDDGTLAVCTYQREHEVIGWHRHDTDGQFLEAVCIPGDEGEDNVWFTVKRTVAGVEKLYLERLSEFFKSDQSIDGKFLDCWLEYSGAPGNLISGLGYLEGKTIIPLVNGAVHPPVVVTGGQVLLDGAYSNVLVGLPYTSRIVPYLPDLRLPDGVAVGRSQRISRLDLMLYRTAGVDVGEIGSSGDDLENISFRMPWDDLGVATPLFQGVISYDFPGGYSNDANYALEITDPIPLTVLCVIDIVEAFD